jgi:hypothetical protein
MMAGTSGQTTTTPPGTPVTPVVNRFPRPAFVYPDNGIVLDYAGLDHPILLGGVEIATGAVLDTTRFPDWAGPRTRPWRRRRRPTRSLCSGRTAGCREAEAATRITLGEAYQGMSRSPESIENSTVPDGRGTAVRDGVGAR